MSTSEGRIGLFSTEFSGIGHLPLGALDSIGFRGTMRGWGRRSAYLRLQSRNQKSAHQQIFVKGQIIQNGAI